MTSMIPAQCKFRFTHCSILRNADKLDTMGAAGGEADFYMVPRPFLWPHQQRIKFTILWQERGGLAVPTHVF